MLKIHVHVHVLSFYFSNFFGCSVFAGPDDDSSRKAEEGVVKNGEWLSSWLTAWFGYC